MVPESPTVTNNPVVVELSVLVVLSLLLQEMMVKLKRSKERRMSRCFIWFPISGLGEPKLYHNLGCFTMCGGIYDIVVIFDLGLLMGFLFLRGVIVLSFFHSQTFL